MIKKFIKISVLGRQDMRIRTKFSKQDLLLGAGSVLEVYPRRQKAMRAHFLRVRARRAASSRDAEQLQADWKCVGEELQRAMRSYGDDQARCST